MKRIGIGALAFLISVGASYLVVKAFRSYKEQNTITYGTERGNKTQPEIKKSKDIKSVAKNENTGSRKREDIEPQEEGNVNTPSVKENENWANTLQEDKKPEEKKPTIQKMTKEDFQSLLRNQNDVTLLGGRNPKVARSIKIITVKLHSDDRAPGDILAVREKIANEIWTSVTVVSVGYDETGRINSATIQPVYGNLDTQHDEEPINEAL